MNPLVVFIFFIYTDTKNIDECRDKYKYETMFVVILIIIYSVVSFAETYGSHIVPAVIMSRVLVKLSR